MDVKTLEQSIARSHPTWRVAVAKSGVACWIQILAAGRRFTIEWVPGRGVGVSELLPSDPEIDFSGHDEEYAELEDALAHVEKALERK